MNKNRNNKMHNTITLYYTCHPAQLRSTAVLTQTLNLLPRFSYALHIRVGHRLNDILARIKPGKRRVQFLVELVDLFPIFVLENSRRVQFYQIPFRDINDLLAGFQPYYYFLERCCWIFFFVRMGSGEVNDPPWPFACKHRVHCTMMRFLPRQKHFYNLISGRDRHHLSSPGERTRQGYQRLVRVSTGEILQFLQVCYACLKNTSERRSSSTQVNTTTLFCKEVA